MRRDIVGFHQDDAGDWVADLSCLHRQHVRHQPPIWPRPWVLTDAGRAAHVGTALDCPLCDRAELPEGLRVTRTAGPFSEASLPAGLRRDHRVGERTWGRVRVLDGSVRFVMDTDPILDRRISAGESQPIPPMTPHRVIVDGPFTLSVDFLVTGGG